MLRSGAKYLVGAFLGGTLPQPMELGILCRGLNCFTLCPLPSSRSEKELPEWWRQKAITKKELKLQAVWERV